LQSLQEINRVEPNDIELTQDKTSPDIVKMAFKLIAKP